MSLLKDARQSSESFREQAGRLQRTKTADNADCPDEERSLKGFCLCTIRVIRVIRGRLNQRRHSSEGLREQATRLQRLQVSDGSSGPGFDSELRENVLQMLFDRPFGATQDAANIAVRFSFSDPM